MQDDKRYVPALAKSSLDAEENTAELFYPAFQDFLQAGSKPETKSETKADEALLAKAVIHKTALLILGDAGTGKSLFIRRHHLMLCRDYFSHQLEERLDRYPLSFHLVLNQAPVEFPLEHYLTRQGFTEDHIRALQAKSRLMIHLDGYDEWSSETQYPWVFSPKSLGGWVSTPGQTQVIITCRSQYLQGNRQYRDVFTPPQFSQKSGYGKALDSAAVSEWVITRLDVGGVARLTHYYVEDGNRLGKHIF